LQRYKGRGPICEGHHQRDFPSWPTPDARRPNHAQRPRSFYAARLQRLKTLELLIAAGADPAVPDPQGRDAVDIARARRLPKDIIARLEELRQRVETRR
jgi:uncharacterized protein